MGVKNKFYFNNVISGIEIKEVDRHFLSNYHVPFFFQICIKIISQIKII